ncbi:MAG TPA: hypothetical protein VGI17_07100 [Solirubrobacterales bacterium]|jgi:hypothetical protein
MLAVALLTATEFGFAALMLIAAVLVAVVIVLGMMLAIVAGAVALGAWSLTRASAAVLGEGGEIWR